MARMTRMTMTRRCLLAWGSIPIAVLAALPGLAKSAPGEVSVPAPDREVREEQAAEDGVWRPSLREENDAAAGESPVRPTAYRRITLDAAALERQRRRAPIEFTEPAKQAPVVLALPAPDGGFARFRIEESPVMEAALAARFPDIRTYRGQGVDDPTLRTRFDTTPCGFHAIVLSTRDSWSIEPDPAERSCESGLSAVHLAYFHRDAPATAGFECGAPGALPPGTPRGGGTLEIRPSSGVAPPFSYGDRLRTYRFAVAVTGEYTSVFGGGTVAGALAAVTTAVNALDAVLESEAAIRLVLVANETAIIYTSGATDGFTHLDRSALAGESQAKLDSVIGAANYDVGDVFDAVPPGIYSPGGVASFGACLDGNKGTSGLIFYATPGNFLTVGFLAHEVGHQFLATHTFNGTTDRCNPSRFAPTAYEPGSGSTIMAYWRLCGAENLASAANYYHTASLEQIAAYTTTGTGACGVSVPTGNGAPTVEPGTDVTIPARTPFTLTASANDPDGDPLAYCWEELDLGAPSPPSTDDGSRPIFRSFPPSADSTRMFPQLFDLVNGWETLGESLPTTNRTMNFRVTVRDLRAGGGGVTAAGTTHVEVWAGSGPFLVTSPGPPLTWVGSDSETVTWDVAGTASPPIGCANVRISMSTDGGASFPIVLAESTPNDGSESITVPSVNTSAARVRVDAVGNIFFNISKGDFVIVPGCSDGGSPHPATVEFCVNAIDEDCDGSSDLADPDCIGPIPSEPAAGSIHATCSEPPQFEWVPGHQTSFRLVASRSADLSAPTWKSPKVQDPRFAPTAAQWKKLASLVKGTAEDETVYWAASGVQGGRRLMGRPSALMIQGPAAPVPMEPADGAEFAAGTASNFTWEAGACNVKFRVEVSDTPDAATSSGRFTSPSLPSPSWTPTADQWSRLVRRFGQGMYWRIAAYDGIGRITRGASRLLRPALLATGPGQGPLTAGGARQATRE